MSLEAWGDENPDDRYVDGLIDDGWLPPDEANDWMKAMLLAAPSCQGRHSNAGRALSEIIGCPFPISMDGLKRRAIEMKYDPSELWPWWKPKSK